jgi:hypothetical protein
VEWFEMKEKGRVVESQLILVPDEYGRSLQLTNILQHLQEQLEQQNVVARYSFYPHLISLNHAPVSLSICEYIDSFLSLLYHVCVCVSPLPYFVCFLGP